ncbi:MAG: DUF3263 domain-containing protein [Comamonadaceae bacterium]|nr:MAG: DUF3263 domain-containing protein [Comamonadaceae bacterium]
MRMFEEDRIMLDFARRWTHYGGAPAGEIWVEFGMTPDRFYEHIQRILGSLTSRSLPPHERHRLEQLVPHRLGRAAR